MSRRRREFAHLIPENVAVLGELGTCAVWNPQAGEFYNFEPKRGTLLCCDAEGREMYALRSVAPGKAIRPDARSVAAMGLHDRFMHRRGNSYYTFFCPPVRRPQYCGEMCLIVYRSQKNFAELGDGQQEWWHYFEQPNVEPAFARFFSLGNGQYFFPRGRWRVADAGIEYADR